MLPARFQDITEESDDGVLCTICSQKEPPGCQAEVMFCDNCDTWVDIYCAFSSNTTYTMYVTLVPPHIKFLVFDSDNWLLFAYFWYCNIFQCK